MTPVTLPGPGDWTLTHARMYNNVFLLVDDAQEPLLLKAISGQLYIKRLEPASAEAQ